MAEDGWEEWGGGDGEQDSTTAGFGAAAARGCKHAACSSTAAGDASWQGDP